MERFTASTMKTDTKAWVESDISARGMFTYAKNVIQEIRRCLKSSMRILNFWSGWLQRGVGKRGSLLVEALGQFPLEVEQEAGPDPDHEYDETHGDDDGAGGGPALLLLLGTRLLALLLAGAGRACSRGLLLAALVGVVVVSPGRGCGGGHRGGGRGRGSGGGGGYVHTHAELFLKLTIMRFSVDSISKDVVLVVYRNKNSRG